jgi:hypothetical protein
MSLLGGVWESTTLAGTPSRSAVASEADHHGILRHTLTDDPSGVVLATPSAVQGSLPVGLQWQVTLRLVDGVTLCEWWSGFASAAARTSTGSVDFVGVRWNGTDLRGVARTGASETITAALATLAVGDWITVSLLVTSAGLVFQVVDASDRALVAVGEPQLVADDIPTGPFLWVAVGGYSETSSDRSCDVDAWGVGGRVAR